MVPKELLVEYAIHLRRAALARSRLKTYRLLSRLEISALNKQFGVSEDLNLLYISKALDSIEESSTDARLHRILLNSLPGRTFGISGGAFRKVIDFTRISQEFGNVASYLSRQEGFFENSRREKFVSYVARRQQIALKHLARIHLGDEPSFQLRLYLLYLYRFMEAVFYYYSPSYWHFFERYPTIRFLTFDLHIGLSIVVFCFYLGYIYLSLVEFLLFYWGDRFALQFFFEFLLWRSHFLFGQSVFSSYIMVPIFVKYPVLALPYLLILSQFPPLPNYYFGTNLVPYRNRLLLALSSVNFLSILLLISCGCYHIPIPFSSDVSPHGLESFSFALDYCELLLAWYPLLLDPAMAQF